MNRVIFKIIGGLLLYFAAVLLFAGVLVLAGKFPRFSLSGSPSIFGVRMVVWVAFCGTIGIGLLRLRKWAALATSILALYRAFWSLWYAIHPDHLKPGEANWLGYIYAFLLLIPSIATVRYWQTLVWR